MKIAAKAKSTVATQGVQSSSSFSIATTAHMFGILSDGLYSDKIGAVLREIGANAMDAHIMAGKPDQPFEVKLPSSFDKSFHIKDFGPGLSDQDVRELYTTYGWSSKQNSNETTGAFGLGSKSPFAYTDAFSICAVKDGVKRIYTAHKDDDGKPVVSLMSEADADDDWLSGVMVTFAVHPDDIPEFVTKAGNIFRWFKVRPTVLGAKLNLEMPQFAIKGPNFGLMASDSENRHARVIMANVAYPLNTSRIDGISSLGHAVASCGVHLFVPTGTVMPTPNREDLQYDKASRPVLVAALQEVAQTVAQEIYDRIKAEECSTWEWRTRIREYAVSLPQALVFKIEELLALVCNDPLELAKLKRLFGQAYMDMPQWVGDGRDGPRASYYDSDGNVLRDSKGCAQLIPATENSCRVWEYRKVEHRDKLNIRRTEIVRGSVRDTKKGEYVRHPVSFTSKVIVVIADAGRAHLRAKYMMELSQDESIRVFMVQGAKGASAKFVEDYAQKLAGDSEAGLGGVPIQKLSDVYLPIEVINRAKSAKRTIEDRREDFQEETRLYVSLTDPSNPLQQVTVGDFAESNDKYFMIRREHRNQAVYKSHTNDSVSWEINTRTLTNIAQNIAVLRQLAPVEGINGFFILESTDVSRLKLMEDGWKPAVGVLSRFVKNDNWLKSIGTFMSKTPEINVDDEYSATSSIPGLLAYHLHQKTGFGNSLKAIMGNHLVVQVAEKIISLHTQKQDDATLASEVAQGVKAWTALTHLNQVLPYGEKLDVISVSPMSAQKLQSKVLAAYPAISLLNFSEMKMVAKNQAQLAANLFWQFTSLCSDAASENAAQELQEIIAA